MKITEKEFEALYTQVASKPVDLQAEIALTDDHGHRHQWALEKKTLIVFSGKEWYTANFDDIYNAPEPIAHFLRGLDLLPQAQTRLDVWSLWIMSLLGALTGIAGTLALIYFALIGFLHTTGLVR